MTGSNLTLPNGKMLFLGLGTGVTAYAAAMDPTLQVDAVELLPEVIEASAYFTHALASDTRLPGPLSYPSLSVTSPENSH